jgi:hypothetical protein
MSDARRRVVLGLVTLLALLLLLCAWRIDRDWFEVHALRLRCAVDPADMRVRGLWRAILAVVGLGLLASLRPISRWLARPRTGVRGHVLRVGVAALLALGVADLLMRSKSHAGEPPPVPIQLPPVREDARLGWVYDGPRTSVIVDDGRAVMYAIDDKGDRVHAQTDAIDPEPPTILFAGESVTFGLGVHWEEAYPTLVGQRLGVQIVNTGVHGYGDDQIQARTLDRLADLRRPVAVVTLVMADLLERDVASWRNRLGVDVDGRLLPVPKQAKVWRTSPVLALAERLGPWQSDESIDVARAIFAATDRAVRACGAYPLFVLTNYQRPCLPDASGRPSIEARIFDGLPVQHIRVDIDAKWIIKTNGHPDARAHALLGAEIAGALAAAHVLPGGDVLPR